MTQEEIIKLAHTAGFNWPDIQATTIEQRLERFASLVAATEREKFTNTQEFVTLPREVVEQVFYHLIRGDADAVCWADGVIKPALEQPQRKLTQQDIADSALLGNIESPFNACMHQEHCKRWKDQSGVAVAQSGGITPNWKLVPVEPTRDMLDFAEKCVPKTPRAQYIAMLSAAPQTTTDKESLTVDHPEPAYLLRDLAADIGVGEMDLIVAIRDAGLGDYSINMLLPARVCVAMCQKFSAAPQPQVEQEPVAVVDFTTEGWREIVDALRTLPDGAQLYTRPQPKREPLTDDQISRLWSDAHNDTTDRMAFQVLARAIEASHNIK